MTDKASTKYFVHFSSFTIRKCTLKQLHLHTLYFSEIFLYKDRVCNMQLTSYVHFFPFIDLHIHTVIYSQQQTPIIMITIILNPRCHYCHCFFFPLFKKKERYPMFYHSKHKNIIFLIFHK